MWYLIPDLFLNGNYLCVGEQAVAAVRSILAQECLSVELKALIISQDLRKRESLQSIVEYTVKLARANLPAMAAGELFRR